MRNFRRMAIGSRTNQIRRPVPQPVEQSADFSLRWKPAALAAGQQGNLLHIAGRKDDGSCSRGLGQFSQAGNSQGALPNQNHTGVTRLSPIRCDRRWAEVPHQQQHGSEFGTHHALRQLDRRVKEMTLADGTKLFSYEVLAPNASETWT